MSDVVRMVLELKDSASPVLSKTSRAAEELARKELELKKLEGALERIAIEAKRATAASDRMAETLERALKRTPGPAKKAGDSVKKVADQTKDLGDKAGDADSIVLGLGGALGALSPEAGAAATALGDVFAATEAILRSGAQVARVLGPVAVAVGALAGTYALLKKKIDDAAEAQRRAAEQASKMMQVHAMLADTELEAARARGELTQAEFDAESASRRATRAFEDQFDALRKEGDELSNLIAKKEKEIATRGQTVDALQRQARANHTSAAAMRENADAVGSLNQAITGANQSGEIAQQRRALTALNKELENLQRRQGNLGQEIETTGAQRDAYRQDLLDIAGASRVTTTAISAVAETVDDLASRLQGAADEMGLLGGEARQLKDPYSKLREELDRMADSLGLGVTKSEKLRLMQMEVEAAFRQGALSAEEYTRALEVLDAASTVEVDITADVTDAVEEVRRLVSWAQSQGITIGEGAVSTAAGAVNFGTSAGSDPLGAAQSTAAATGPWGQLVAAMLGALDMLSQKTEDGTSQITANILASDKALVDGVKALPDFLSEDLGRIIETTATRVPVAIIEALPEILKEAVIFSHQGLPEATLKVIPALIEAFAGMIGDLLNQWLGRDPKGPSGSSTDAQVEAEQDQYSTAVLGGGTAEENQDAFREGLSGGSGTSSARTVRGLQFSLANARAAHFNDPAISSLRRMQMAQSVAAASGNGLGSGGDIHLHSEYFDGTAIDRIEQKLQRRQGAFGHAMPRPVFNTGAG